MDHVLWLQSLSRAIRDDLSDCAMEWVPILRTWRLSDDQWDELKRQVILNHRRGPLRMADLQEYAMDIVERTRMAEGRPRIAEVTRPEAG